jgi:hypothetical protein
VTSPDKPDTAATERTESTSEERTVATAAVESSPSNAANGTVAGTVSGTATDQGTNGVKPPAQPAPKPAAQPVAKPAAQPAPKPAEPEPAPEPTTTAVPPVESPQVTSAAPPPWQRVGADTQYIATSAPTETPEPAGGFADWGYQRSPRSNAYSDTGVTSGMPLSGEYPVVSGTAAASVFAATAGQSGVRPDARPGADPTNRTTVNFGTPVDPIRPPTGAAAPSALRRPGRGPRRASLQVKRIDPWSVLKLSFVLSVALFFVWLVAVGVLYGVLDGMGVWDRVNGTYNEFAQSTTSAASGGPLITASRVFGIAAIIGAINIVLFTALATVGSFVYNVSADLAGGLEITLAERE